jgi:hypothetical protein
LVAVRISWTAPRAKALWGARALREGMEVEREGGGFKSVWERDEETKRRRDEMIVSAHFVSSSLCLSVSSPITVRIMLGYIRAAIRVNGRGMDWFVKD